MERYKKLSNQFYSLDLYTGKTNFKIGHNILCFFIVEHPCDEAFIKEQALQLLMTPCRNFEFYGTYSRQWENGFNEVYNLLHPNEEKRNVLIRKWDSFTLFVDQLLQAISCRYLVPCDTYLIYDNEQIYKTTLNELLKDEYVQRYHSDWLRISYEKDNGT